MNVHALWVGGHITAMQWASMNSFIRTGHDFCLYTDDVSRSVPTGVKTLPIPSYMPRKIWRFGKRAEEGAGSPAIFADLLRAEHLYRHGGWWTDLDVICLRKLPPIPKCGIAAGWQEPPEQTGRRFANVAILGAQPRHAGTRLLLLRVRYPWLGSPWQPFLRRVYHGLRLIDTVYQPWNIWWGYSGGPVAITEIMKYLGLEDELFPHDMFYPVHYENWRDLLVDDLSQVKADLSRTVAVHLWAELYREAHVNPNDVIERTWMSQYLDGWKNG